MIYDVNTPAAEPEKEPVPAPAEPAEAPANPVPHDSEGDPTMAPPPPTAE